MIYNSSLFLNIEQKGGLPSSLVVGIFQIGKNMSLIVAENLLKENIERIVELGEQLSTKISVVENSIAKNKWGAARRQLLFLQEGMQEKMRWARELVNLDEIKASVWAPRGTFARNLEIYKSTLTRLRMHCISLARLQHQVDVHFSSYMQTSQARFIGRKSRKRRLSAESLTETEGQPSRQEICTDERAHERKESFSTELTR